MAIDFESLGFAEVGGEEKAQEFQPAKTNRFFARNKFAELGFEEVPESLTTGEKFQSAGASLLRGTGALLASIPKGIAVAKKGVDHFVPGAKYIPSLAMLIPPDTVIEKTKEVEDWAGSLAPQEAEALKNSWLWQKFPRAVGSAVGFLAGGAAGAALKVPAWAGAASLGTLSTYSETYEDAKAHGADEETALAAAFASTPLGASEAVPMGKWINRLSRATGGGFKRVFLNSTKETVEEAIQEAFQASGGDLIAKGFYDPDRELFRDLREAAATGGAVGLFMSLLTQTVGNSLGKRRARGEGLRSRYDSKAIDEFKPVTDQPQQLERPIEAIPVETPTAVPVRAQPEVVPVGAPQAATKPMASEVDQLETLEGIGRLTSAQKARLKELRATPEPTKEVAREGAKVATGKAGETILAVASKVKQSDGTEEVLTGKYHGHIVEEAYRKYGEGAKLSFEDGFITNTGRFVGRDEAAKIMGEKEELHASYFDRPNAPTPEARSGEPAGGTAAVVAEAPAAPVAEVAKEVVSLEVSGRLTNEDFKVGDKFQNRGDKHAAGTGGTVKKVNPTTIVVETEYMGKPMELRLKKREIGGELRILREGKLYSSEFSQPKPTEAPQPIKRTDSSIASGGEGGNVGASNETDAGETVQASTQDQEGGEFHIRGEMPIAAMAEDLRASGQVLRGSKADIYRALPPASSAPQRSDVRTKVAGATTPGSGDVYPSGEQRGRKVSEEARVFIEETTDTQIPTLQRNITVLAHGILRGSNKKAGPASVIDGFDFVQTLAANRLTGLRVVFEQFLTEKTRADYIPRGTGEDYDILRVNLKSLANYDLRKEEDLELWASSLVEEVIHAATFRVSSQEELTAVWNSLEDTEQNEVLEVYATKLEQKSEAIRGAEYVRMILQDRLFGHATEQKKRNLTTAIKEHLRKLLNWLMEAFGRKPENDIARQVVERIERALRDEASIPQSIFGSSESAEASSDRPIADIIQSGDVDEAGDDYVPTDVMGVEFGVIGKDNITPEDWAKSGAIAKAAFDEAGVEVKLSADEKPRYEFVNDGTQQNAAGQRLVEIVRREVAKYGQGGKEVISLIQSVRIGFGVGEMEMFSLPIRNKLFALAQGDASFRGTMLAALRGAGRDLRFIMQNVDVHLQRVWHESYGGTEIDGVLAKVRARFKAFFTPEVIAEIVKNNPAIAAVDGAEKIISDGLNTDFASLTELRDTLASLIGASRQQEASQQRRPTDIARQMVEALKPRIRTAAGDAARDIEGALTPDERIAVKGGKKPIWQRIVDMVARGEFDNAPLLRERARQNDWEPPSDEKIARIKRLAERERALEKLTQKEVDDAGGDKTKLAREQIVRNESTIPRRVELMRQIEAEWASITRPVNLRPWRFLGKYRANNAAFMNELASANLLVRASFFPKQAISVFSQFMVHIPTRAIGQAIELHAQSKALGQETALGKDVYNALSGGFRSALAGYRDGMAQFVAAFRGRGEVRNVDRLMSGISALERMDTQAKLMAERGDFGAAALQYLTAFMRLGYRIAQAFDNLHGVPSEYIEMRHRTVLELMKNGMERFAANEQANNIIESIKKEHIFALAEAKAFLDANGEKYSANQLRETSHRIARKWAYENIRALGLPADDFAASARQLRETIGWNEREAGFNKGVGGIVGGAAAEFGKVGEKLGIPLAIGRFGNAIAISINRALHFTPLGFFPGAFGENNAWYRTEIDRNQRKTEAALGTTIGSIAFMLAASGLITVYLKWPRDPEERDLFEADGHRPGTIEVGKVAISMNTGLAAFLAPYFAAGGALRDLLTEREKKQAKLNEEAARKGVPPESIRPMSMADMVGVAAQAGYHTILGGRTAAGSLASISDYGVPNVTKLAASQTGPLIPGLPALQEVSRMGGVVLDSKLATFTDFLLPLPSSPARRVNFLGDPSGTPDDMQRIVQVLTGGTYGPIDPSESKARQAYSALFTTGYRPPSINPSKGYAIGNSFRPFTDAELEQYSAVRGQEFRDALGGLPADVDIKAVRAAYRAANQRALGRLGVRVTLPKVKTARGTRSRLRGLRGRRLRTLRARRRKGLRSLRNIPRLAYAA